MFMKKRSSIDIAYTFFKEIVMTRRTSVSVSIYHLRVKLLLLFAS